MVPTIARISPAESGPPPRLAALTAQVTVGGPALRGSTVTKADVATGGAPSAGSNVPVTVTSCCVSRLLGAENNPELDTVPTPPEVDQTTVPVDASSSVAVNCKLVEAARVAFPGLSFMLAFLGLR